MINFLTRLLAMQDERGRLEDNYVDELHFQSSRMIIFASLASLLWLNYIPVDKQLHPDEPMIIWIRMGTIVVSGIILTLFRFSYFRAKSQFLLLSWGAYLIFGAGIIAGLTGNDQAYFAGFLLTMSLLPMGPLQKCYTYPILFFAILFFLLISLSRGVDFSQSRMLYSVNDIISATIAISFFIFMLDKIRHYSWSNAKIIEARSEQKIDQVKAESIAKSRFLATMSHEIRTPMNGVLGMIDLLQTTPLNAQQKQYLDVVSGSGKALLNIINDILDYSKIEAGKLELESVPVNLDKICADIAALFGLMAEEKYINFFVSSAPELPLYIKTDPTRLRQILLNLLGNAFKFTHSGNVYLEVKPVENNSSKILFEITDTGIGMSAEQVDKLFKAFNQADSSTTRKYGGTGLGLSISKRLVGLMGGEIGVESKLNHGAKFWFTIEALNQVDCSPETQTYKPLVLNNKTLSLGYEPGYVKDIITNYATLWGMKVTASTPFKAAQQLNRKAPFDCIWVSDASALDSATGRLGEESLGEDSLEEGSFAQERQKETRYSSEKQARVMTSKQIFKSFYQKELQAIKKNNQFSSEPESKSMAVILSTSFQPPDKQELDELCVSHAIKTPYSIRSVREALVSVFEQPSLASESTSEQNLLLSNLYVLVAEDNLVNQIVIKKMLTKLGATYRIVDDGKEAIEEFKNSRPDIILMDCEMPEVDGFEATIKIRELEKQKKLKATPIIAVTAHVMDEHVEHCYQAGMDDCLSKPVALKALSDKLIKVINAK